MAAPRRDAMTYRVPGERKKALRSVLDRLRAGREVVLTTHVNADGDGIGCQVALQDALRRRGAHAWIVNPTPFPDRFGFLLDDESVVLDASTERAREVCAGADLLVVVDTGEVSRIGRVRGMVKHLDTIVIDHHPAGPDPISGISFRDPEACATGELIYDIVSVADGPWSQAVLQGLYVAILTDTGSFRFSNSTPAAHRITADLIERGVDPEGLHREIYGARSVRSLHLLRESLETLDVDEERLVAAMIVPREAYQRLEAEPEDLEAFVDFPRSVEDVEVGILFRTTQNGDTKMSLRSNGDADVNAIARKFGGGGHVKAAGATVRRPVSEVVPEVLEVARDAARKVREAS